jgi:tetratricopeptide (TPR) repeat protein
VISAPSSQAKHSRIEYPRTRRAPPVGDGENALSIFPNQAALYLLTSIGYAQTQKHEKAVSYLKTAASLETEDKEVIAQIYSGLGDSYHALKRFPESDEAYSKALQIKPDNSYTLNNFAYYLSLRGESLEKAEEMSKRSIELDPNNASSEDTYALILFKRKKFREARSSARTVPKGCTNSAKNSAITTTSTTKTNR